MSADARNICVITNVDSFLGFALAYRIIDVQKRGGGQNLKLRAFYQDKQGFDLEILEKMGAEVVQVNYEDEEKLCQALKNIHTVSLIPEHSERTVKEAECLMKACKRQNIDFFYMHSIIGVDRVREHQIGNEQGQYQTLERILEIERKVQENFGDKHSIIRHSMFNQFFYFMAPQFENDNFLGLPMKENVKWNCVDVNDVINAVYILMHRGMGNKVTHDKKLYQFTSSRTMTPRDMVREISEGLGRSDLKFEEVPVKDMKDYLMRMKNDHRFKERHGQCEEYNRWDHDGPWSIPIGKYLNSWSIEMIVECMRLANDSKQDICTDDLKKILSAEPRDLKHYFKNNSNQFKQFK